MYAKLNNNRIMRSPNKVTYNGRTIFNPPEDILTALGYYPVIYTDMPDNADKGKYYTSYWEQTENAIVQKWQLEDIPQVPEIPTEGERLEALEQAMLELAEVLADG